VSQNKTNGRKETGNKWKGRDGQVSGGGRVVQETWTEQTEGGLKLHTSMKWITSSDIDNRHDQKSQLN
jgi:hypothetical protein